jgi:hypothetical protein
MQQRTALTRALVHDPAMLLMDEPLKALHADPKQMNVELQRIWLERKKTVVFIALHPRGYSGRPRARHEPALGRIWPTCASGSPAPARRHEHAFGEHVRAIRQRSPWPGAAG